MSWSAACLSTLILKHIFVRFSESPTFVRVDVFPSLFNRKFPLSTICCFVRDRVCHGLEEILENPFKHM